MRNLPPRVFTLLCAYVVLSGCSREASHLQRRVQPDEIFGKWQLSVKSVERLKRGNERDAGSDNCLVVLQSTGECNFQSYSSVERKLIRGQGHWSLEHDVVLEGGERVRNRIAISLQGAVGPETIFVGRLGRRLTLWEKCDNGWGDAFVLVYLKN